MTETSFVFCSTDYLSRAPHTTFNHCNIIGSIITTNENETAAVAPAALQIALQAAMDDMISQESSGNGPKPRCFVRPSGTEDAVRVYAEANTQKGADTLAYEAMMLIYKLCGGVGAPPQPLITNRL